MWSLWVGQAGCVKVSDVVESASGSSQGLVHPLMPIYFFCFNACICIIVAFFPDCLWGRGLEAQLCLVWESTGELVSSDPVHGLVCQLQEWKAKHPCPGTAIWRAKLQWSGHSGRSWNTCSLFLFSSQSLHLKKYQFKTKIEIICMIWSLLTFQQ